MNMITLANLGIVCIVIFFMFTGYRQGFLLKLVSIFSFFVLGFVAWYLSQPLASLFTLYPQNAGLQTGIPVLESVLYDNLNRMMIFIVLFVVLQIVFLIIRPILRFLNHIPVVSTLNKVAGCLLGALQALLVLFFISLLLRLPFWENGNTIASQSYLRYCAPLSKLVLFYTEEPVDALTELSGSIQEKKTFTQAEASDFYQWLLEQNISKENADEIVSKLRIE